MLDSETKRRIDTARDILVGKVPDPKSQVEQITIALIYKFMDDLDEESVKLGGKRSFAALKPDAYVADETNAPARSRAYQPLLFAAVTDRLARGVDAAGEGRIRHDPAAPDRRDEIILADDALAVLHQVSQQIEHLRLDRNLCAATV